MTTPSPRATPSVLIVGAGPTGLALALWLTRTTLSGFDGALAGMTGTRQNGKIVWSNSAVWDNFDFNALNVAVAANNADMAALLLDAGSNVETDTSGLTPLMFAASSGNVDMIRFLVKRGANSSRGQR